MKKAKTKRKKGPVRGSVERRVPYQKAAIRSSAFARALLNAGSIGRDPERLRALFEEAGPKVASIPKEPFKDSWPYLQAMLRLIREPGLSGHLRERGQARARQFSWHESARRLLAELERAGSSGR